MRKRERETDRKERERISEIEKKGKVDEKAR